MQVGLQWFGLTGRQFGRSKKRFKNKMIIFQPATLILTQNVVMQMVP